MGGPHDTQATVESNLQWEAHGLSATGGSLRASIECRRLSSELQLKTKSYGGEPRTIHGRIAEDNQPLAA